MNKFRWAAWAPGRETRAAWAAWAGQDASLDLTSDTTNSTESPKLSWTDPLFRRRLGQLSRMTVQVAHDLLPFKEDAMIFFVSLRGEISRQLKINKAQIEEKTIMPASFSLSVFNAPPALATMAVNFKGGYTALYPETFTSGLEALHARAVSRPDQQTIFIYGDETVPDEYLPLFPQGVASALCFGFVLEKGVDVNGVPSCQTPEAFLRSLILADSE